MPRKSSEDYKNTRHYIPQISHEFRSPIKEKLRNLEIVYINEGRVVFDNFKFRIPCEGACVFSDRWSLNELVYGAPSEGPYKTNLPSPDDIISLILPYGMLLTRLFDFIISEYPELKNESYVLYDCVMTPLRPTRAKTRGIMARERSSNHFFISSFDNNPQSHLNDDDDDGNDEGTSRASTPSPIRYVNSLTNQVPQVFQNPP
ncbi:hypothetical protein Tco_0180251 [Tanacetum coccineum]